MVIGATGAIYVDHINKAKDGDDDGWLNTPDGYDNIKAKHNLTRSKIKKDMLKLVHREHNITDFKSGPGKRKGLSQITCLMMSVVHTLRR